MKLLLKQVNKCLKYICKITTFLHLSGSLQEFDLHKCNPKQQQQNTTYTHTQNRFAHKPESQNNLIVINAYNGSAHTTLHN